MGRMGCGGGGVCGNVTARRRGRGGVVEEVLRRSGVSASDAVAAIEKGHVWPLFLLLPSSSPITATSSGSSACSALVSPESADAATLPVRRHTKKGLRRRCEDGCVSEQKRRLLLLGTLLPIITVSVVVRFFLSFLLLMLLSAGDFNAKNG